MPHDTEANGAAARGRPETGPGPDVADGPPRATLHVQRLGTVPYGEALSLQQDLVQRRRNGEIGDTLLLLQHPHVITLGTGWHQENVLLGAEDRARLGIEMFQAGRGGDVTYHGPGQLVGYPILDLQPDRCDLHRYLRDLEEVLIAGIGEFGLHGERRVGLTGVWVGDRKIAAIGIRVSSGWITSHGFALNVDTDLTYFESIVPCGIREYGVGSLSGELGREISIDESIAAILPHFGAVFGRQLTMDRPPSPAPGGGRDGTNS